MPAKSTLTCAHCGATFEAFPSNHRRYCSSTCFGAARVAAGYVAVPRTPIEERLWSKVDKTGECWLWTGGANNKGYGVISKGGHVSRKMLTHRLSYELAYGPIPAGMAVCHRCDTPLCLRPAHLFLASQAENIADMWQKGRQAGQFTADDARGERNRTARLTTAQVVEIRRRHAQGGITLVALAAEYGVTPNNVGSIVARNTWKHVE